MLARTGYDQTVGGPLVSLEQAVASPMLRPARRRRRRVIKIERAGGRLRPRIRHRGAGHIELFRLANRGKESLVADIKQPGDAALLHRLVAGADVFSQNLAPGAAARSGFGSEVLRSRNPRLITVDISGMAIPGNTRR